MGVTKFCEECVQPIKEGEKYYSAKKNMHMHYKCMSPDTRAVADMIKAVNPAAFAKMQEDLKKE